MAQITRPSKAASGGEDFAANSVLVSTELNADFEILKDGHNAHDDGSTAWQVVKAENATTLPLIANNSTGTQNIAELRDNGTAVVTVADGGATTVLATGGSAVPLTVNNGTSTGNILELKDNGTTVVSVADGGAVTVSPGGTTKVVADSSGITMSNSATIAMGSAKVTGLANGTAATDAAAYGQLKILQVVSATHSSDFNTTNTAFQQTGLQASITPSSASNKVLVFVSGSLSQDTQNNTAYMSIGRGASNIGPANGFAALFTVSGGNTCVPLHMTFMDSPATTSSTTYHALLRVGGGTGHFGVNSEVKSIVLMEVAG